MDRSAQPDSAACNAFATARSSLLISTAGEIDMNNEPRSLTDDELFAVLRAALDAAEPAPAAAVDAAYAAIEMDMLSEELAVLAFDSSAGTLVEMRATEAEVRLLSFVNDHLTVDV